MRTAVTPLGIVAVVVLAALAFGPVAAGGPASDADGVGTVVAGSDAASATGSPGLHRMTAIHRDEDGGWWVLERPDTRLGNGPAVVYEHDESWDHTGTTHRLAAAGNRSSAAVDIARAPGGGWYVLNASGVVFRYTDDWEYTGDSRRLPRPPESGVVFETWSLTRTPDGRWLVDAGGTTVRYDSEFETVLGTTDRVGTAGATFDDGSLVVVGREVTRYEYGADGAGVGARTGRTGYLPGHPPYPVDLARTEDGGWWVATGGGSVVEYDAHWIHTGVERDVGSGNAVGRTPGDVIGPWVLLAPLVDGLVLLVPGLAVLLGALAFAAYRGPGWDVPVAVLASVGYAYAVLYQPYPLRAAFVWNGELSVLVPVVGLALPVAHAVGHEDASVDAVLPYLPVVVASALLLVRMAGA